MSTIRLMLNGQEFGFEIRRLPPNKRVDVQFAVRDTASGMVLIVSRNGTIYSDNVNPNRSWSWQHGIGTRVASALKTAGIITQAQYDSHVEARASAAEASGAFWDLRRLTEVAEQYGIALSGEGFESLRARAALHKE